MKVVSGGAAVPCPSADPQEVRAGQATGVVCPYRTLSVLVLVNDAQERQQDGRLVVGRGGRLLLAAQIHQLVIVPQLAEARAARRREHCGPDDSAGFVGFAGLHQAAGQSAHDAGVGGCEADGAAEEGEALVMPAVGDREQAGFAEAARLLWVEREGATVVTFGAGRVAVGIVLPGQPEQEAMPGDVGFQAGGLEEVAAGMAVSSPLEVDLADERVGVGGAISEGGNAVEERQRVARLAGLVQPAGAGQ